jgi:signal transduction histidine kinase
LLDKIDHLFPNFAVSIRLYNGGTRTWEGVACSNMDEADWRTTASKSGSGITQAVVDAGKPLVIPDTQLDPRTHDQDFQRRNGLVSYLGVPLIVKYEILGVIGFFSKVRHEYSPQEVELLSTLASQAAIAIQNAQLYDRLKHANETLEQTLEVKSILTGVMAHELKTPIQVIMGTASLLAEGMCGELNQEQRERIGKIEAGSEEMLQLIESSLDMARLEQGKMPLLVTEIRVRELLAELESEFSETFAKKGLALEVNHPPLGSTIKSDRVKLKETLRNIIDNARKYTVQGKVSLEFAVKDAERVEFVVKDTGIGIKAELLPKIFELFYQVDPSQKEHASAGLGLNIVKRLVDAMSGEIDVTSEVGRGSVFRVTFPREISTHLPQ